MKLLLYYEIKKLLYSWKSCALLGIVILSPFVQVLVVEWMDQRNVIYNENSSISVQQQKEEMDTLRKDIAGSVTPSYIEKRKQELNALQEESVDVNDIHYQTIHQAYYDTFNYYNFRQGILYSKDAPDVVKQDILNHTPKYGPYEGWLDRMEIYKNTALCHLVVCVLLFGNLFNQEHAVGIMDLLKSSKLGTRQLAWAKILSTWIITIIMGLLMYGVLEISSRIFLELSGSDTTIMMLENAFQIYNFSQINMQAFLLTMIAGLGCSLLSLFTSTLFQKPLHSLMIAGCIYIIPQYFSIEIQGFSLTQLFPSVFVQFQGRIQIMSSPWLVFPNNYAVSRAVGLTCVWGVLCVILTLLTWYLHCRKKQNFIRKKGIS